MVQEADTEFSRRIDAARAFKPTTLLQIGDVLTPDAVPFVEGVWGIGERTIVEVSGHSDDPDLSLLPDEYPVSDPDRAWFVAFVAPAANAAERVRRFTGRLGFRSYWPRAVRMQKRGRGEKRREVPVVATLFPRYALVHLPVRWVTIAASTATGLQTKLPTGAPFGLLTSHEARFNAVAGLVGSTGQPIHVPDPIVARIVTRERAGEFNKTARQGTKTVAKTPSWAILGSLVRITNGHLTSHIGEIEEIDARTQCVKVGVTIFGRVTPAELALADVEPIC